MFDIPEVPCTIVQPENKLLTMRDADAPLTLEEPTGNPGEQEWVIERRSEDTVALRNLKHDKYAGVLGEIYGIPSVVAVQDPFKFKIEEAPGRHCYKLYVEAGGEQMYLDFSMLRIFPPQCALLPITFAGKPWSFKFSD